MKLKEWGLMRHKTRKNRLEKTRVNSPELEVNDEEPSGPLATAEPMSVDSETLEHRTKTGGWQVVSGEELKTAQPTFMGMLSQTPE